MSTTPENVICGGGTFDNCATNKAAWKILEKDYPDKVFIGCIAHGDHLMIGDIIEKMPGYKTSIASANELVKFIFRHQKVPNVRHFEIENNLF